MNSRLLVIIFGGADHHYLSKFDCPNLKQAHWGKVSVDNLWQDRDVATQITAQLITGKTWEENGVNERKKVKYIYHGPISNWAENTLFKNIKRGRARRNALYTLLGERVTTIAREFLKDDLTCPTLFDLVENSQAVYVPSYNPEPTWALDRNILDPRKYPEMGVEAALDLREKHFYWRKKRLMEALDGPPKNLLMAQFQYLDSTQHLYLSYHEEDQIDEVEKAYHRIDKFAGEIIEKARGVYDRILFISDNGAARKIDYKPTHHNRPFYSLNKNEEISDTNMRDFFNHILNWTGSYAGSN
ncbi:hypothetical protein [Microbulbifer sp. ALW1]|uniref:hypothetical protein n=1 Tax=Microbulbifer sp. (strain ALW1) TaxID=1516059 RepID=UPI001356CDF8|nr:hypothetical protein [Microbulbifer sp. ALW1]